MNEPGSETQNQVDLAYFRGLLGRYIKSYLGIVSPSYWPMVTIFAPTLTDSPSVWPIFLDHSGQNAKLHFLGNYDCACADLLMYPCHAAKADLVYGSKSSVETKGQTSSYDFKTVRQLWQFSEEKTGKGTWPCHWTSWGLNAHMKSGTGFTLFELFG